jgi:alpha-L-rhamnosidase
MNSRNHFAFGAVGQWYYESLAGIELDPEKPGFKHFIIHPRPAGDLQWAKATHDSPYGKIEAGWRLNGQSMTVEATVPANTSARIYVPTLGNKTPQITVGPGPEGEAAKSVKHVGIEHDCSVYEVPAGVYRFDVSTN